MNINRAKAYATDILYDIAAGFFQAISIHCFIDPIDIVPGGASGLAILINRFTGLGIGFLTFLINIPLLIASWCFLGHARTLKTLKTVAILTVILDFIVTPFFPVYIGDKMISTLFGGVFMGASLALVFMRGSTTGGGDIAAKLLQKVRPHMQTGTAVAAIDLAVICLSMAVFGNIESGLYSLIEMVVASYVIDLILYGNTKSTMITVMSEKTEEIAEKFMNELDRGATFFQSRGAYSGKDSDTLVCVLDRKQYYRAKKIVYDIDPDAFVIVSETKEVYGEGFLDSDWEV